MRDTTKIGCILCSAGLTSVVALEGGWPGKIVAITGLGMLMFSGGYELAKLVARIIPITKAELRAAERARMAELAERVRIAELAERARQAANAAHLRLLNDQRILRSLSNRRDVN